MTGPKILVVDDRAENLTTLEAVLGPLNLEVVTARSGEEALKRLLHADFAVILLDAQMPDMSGYEVAGLIKERERTRHIPIIFLTATSADASQELRGYSVGAVDYIFKPFDPVVLRSKVQVFVDLYELKQRAEQLAHRAVHDPVTALPNRVLFLDRLEMALARLKRRPTRVAVFFLDLDGFKRVNDDLGHEAGDELLVAVAERLRTVLRPSDTVARFGGDEFTILSEGMASESDVGDIAGRIQEAIATPFTLSAGGVKVSASIGISIAEPQTQTRPEAMLREADTAMYRAKQNGGHRYELYDSAMRSRAARRAEFEDAMQSALDRGEFLLHYQPIADLRDGRIVSVEALLRWTHPEQGLVDAASFLPSVEDIGLISPVGEWALHEATRDFARWREPLAGPPVTLSMNLSAGQLAQADLVGVIEKLIAGSGMPASRFGFEVSEQVAVLDMVTTRAVMEGLRDLGASVTIDDFGSSVTSLADLGRLPIHRLKIDPSIVSGIDSDKASAALARGIVGLGHALGLKVVAEGVETPGQLVGARELGCDEGQGRFLAAPQAAGSIEDLVVLGAIDVAAS